MSALFCSIISAIVYFSQVRCLARVTFNVELDCQGIKQLKINKSNKEVIPNRTHSNYQWGNIYHRCLSYFPYYLLGLSFNTKVLILALTPTHVPNTFNKYALKRSTTKAAQVNELLFMDFENFLTLAIKEEFMVTVLITVFMPSRIHFLEIAEIIESLRFFIECNVRQKLK